MAVRTDYTCLVSKYLGKFREKKMLLFMGRSSGIESSNDLSDGRG